MTEKEDIARMGFWGSCVSALLKENRDKWVRDMICITTGSCMTNYYHVGGYVLHPYMNLMFYLKPEKKSAYPSSNLDSFNLEIETAKKEEVKGEFGISLDPFRRKDWMAALKQINFRHLCTITYKVKPKVHWGDRWKTDEEKPFIKYQALIQARKIQIDNQQEKLRSIGRVKKIKGLPPRYWNLDCRELTNEDVVLFQRIHNSLPRHIGRFMPFNDQPQKQQIRQWRKGRAEEAEREKRREAERVEWKKREEAADWAREKKPKRIYLMKDGSNGYYKIGISDNPQHREKTLQSEKPDIDMIGHWEQTTDQEKDWHCYFSDQRLRGEWFKLTDVQVKFFCLNARKGATPPARSNSQALQPSPDHPSYIRITEAARRSSLGRSKVYQLVRDNHIESCRHKIGKKSIWLVNYKSLRDYILSCAA